MESSEAAARRMSRLAYHLAATPQNSCTSSLTSMVCSSSSGMQSSSRKDGRLLFARQESHHPLYFQDHRECQGSNASPVCQGNACKHSRLLFSRQGSHTQAFYMRECVEYQVFPSEKEDKLCNQCQSNVEEPDVSRKVSAEFKQLKDNLACLNVDPLFAKPVNKGCDGNEVTEATSRVTSPINAKHNELDWLPRMDIAESWASYVVTVELPGVPIDGIRVEVNEDRLFVSGSRSPQIWTDSTERNEKAIYHCKELSQGPFRVQWPMPRNINLDGVSADFMDGFLRIVLPKIMA